MAKKKVVKSDNQQHGSLQQTVQQASKHQDLNRYPKQSPARTIQTEPIPKLATVHRDEDLTDHSIKSSQQTGNRKRQSSVVQKLAEVTKTVSWITVDDAGESDVGLSNKLNTCTSQTSLRPINSENENKRKPEEITAAVTTESVNSNEGDQTKKIELIKANQRQKVFLEGRTIPVTNYQPQRQHNNYPIRHCQPSSYQPQGLPINLPLQHSIQIPTVNTLSKNRNQYPVSHHPHLHHIHQQQQGIHQQQGMVTLPAIHSNSTNFVQHAGNQQQQAMNNVPSTSGEFLYLQQYQQALTNQHMQQQLQSQLQPHLHQQQTPFPIITHHPHSQHLINQIPIHFPAIVTNHNIIPLTTHPTTQLPSAVIPQHNSFIANCDPQQNQTIYNPQQYIQQTNNTNFQHHWQIQQQQKHQQQQIQQSNQQYRSQLLYQQQQLKANPFLTPFFQQPLKQPNPPQQSFTFTPQHVQPISVIPKPNPQHQMQEIPIITTDTEDKNAPPPNQPNVIGSLQKDEVNSIEQLDVLSNTSNKATTSTAQISSTASTTSIANTSGVVVPVAVATNTASNNQGVNLYVKHLDGDVDDCALKKMFSRFGEVVSAKVMMEGQASRGFGFVCFARAEDAARATREIRRKSDDLSLKNLYVAPAQRKEERQAFFREKLKSFMGEPLPEDESSFLAVNCKPSNQPQPKSSLRQPPSCLSMESKRDEIKVSSSSQGEEKMNAKSIQSCRPTYPGKSNQFNQCVAKKTIFDLDNFSLERLNIPLIQHASFPVNLFDDEIYVNQESQSEPIPEWFYEADDDDEDDRKNGTGDAEVVREKPTQNSISNFNELNQFWPAFKSPTKSCKYTDTQKSNDLVIQNDIRLEDVENQNKESVSNLDIPSDKTDSPSWIVPRAWNCKLITKEDTHICKVSSANSEASSSPDSLYDCKRLVTDCIACCTDTDSAEEDEGDQHTFHSVSAQNGHNNNSNAYLSMSRKRQGDAKNEELSTVLIEITSCSRCKIPNRKDRRMQCSKLNCISDCEITSKSQERKENIRRKRKGSSLYDHDINLEHTPMKRRFVIQRFSEASMILS